MYCMSIQLSEAITLNLIGVKFLARKFPSLTPLYLTQSLDHDAVSSSAICEVSPPFLCIFQEWRI